MKESKGDHAWNSRDQCRCRQRPQSHPLIGTYEPDNALIYQQQSTLPTAALQCSCSPGYTQQADGSCYLHRPDLWELIRKSRVAVAILSLLIIAIVSIPVVVLIRRRLARLSRDVELHQYLLADAEENVLALQKGWQIGGDEVKLLARIDGDSPGAFGEVWKADWEGLSVCVKVLKQQMGTADSLTDFDAEISFLQPVPGALLWGWAAARQQHTVLGAGAHGAWLA